MASATSLPPAADAEAAARTRALEASLDAMVAAEMNLFHRAESEAILMHVHRWGWRWLVASLFCLPDPQPIRIDLPHTEEQVEMIEEEKRRSTEVGYLEMLAIHHQLATKCLSHYNSMHPGKEYEPAPGWLTQNHFFHNGARWAHGNFLARPKRSGCFSFLPGPRTLFFFELASRRNSDQVVTCTRLDEPVTEAYSVLGVPLWWSKRRDGKMDTFCKICSRRFDDIPHDPRRKKVFPCGHSDVKKVCEMCYRRSGVLHPGLGEFTFGYHEPEPDLNYYSFDCGSTCCIRRG